MRDRWFRMVVTIATSATIACGDEAVDSVTAPKPAAMPAEPATSQWPSVWEFAGYPTAASIQISSNAYFTADNKHVIYNADPTMIGHVYAARVSEEFLKSLS